MASPHFDTPVVVVVVVVVGGGGGGGSNLYICVCILCCACWGENVGYKCLCTSIPFSPPPHSFLALHVGW